MHVLVYIDITSPVVGRAALVVDEIRGGRGISVTKILCESRGDHFQQFPGACRRQNSPDVLKFVAGAQVNLISNSYFSDVNDVIHLNGSSKWCVSNIENILYTERVIAMGTLKRSELFYSVQEESSSKACRGERNMCLSTMDS